MAETHGRINSGKYGTNETREARAAYQRRWRAQHPDAVREIRIKCAVKLLERNGYTVKAPKRRAPEPEPQA